jgi:hypothetical protein
MPIYQLLFFPTILLGLVVHFWSTIIAFTEAGVLPAIATFLLPVLSQIYWLVVVAGEQGLLAPFSILVMIFLALLTTLLSMMFFQD